MADGLSAALRCLSLSSEDDSITISYLQHLARSTIDFFTIKWGGVAVKNCDSQGDLLEFKSKSEAAKSKQAPWLYLPLKIFKIQVKIYFYNILFDKSNFE